MCGILGLSLLPTSSISERDYQKLVRNLFLYSQSRGKESSGIAVNDGKNIKVIKTPHSADWLLKSVQFKELVNQDFRKSKYFSLIGHARLVTNGSMAENNNNQPVIKDGIVGIHNGIITNDDFIWQKFKSLNRNYQVDTEVLLALINHFNQLKQNLGQAIVTSFNRIEGSASLACYFDNYPYLALATNTGSLYYYFDKIKKIFIFASEKYILRKSIAFLLGNDSFESQIVHLQARSGGIINLSSLNFQLFNFANKIKIKPLTTNHKLPISNLSPSTKVVQTITNSVINPKALSSFQKHYQQTKSKIEDLKRCTRCILPETMPFINFDEQGVCNYCRNYQPIKLQGKKALDKLVTKIKKENQDKDYDCLLPFSGGRDSSYALHYLVKELGLRTIVYTYDWGMITDLGRRNQARMCGKLGVEQILHSANISQKRNNIRKNILAWLAKPDLGMIPLFMAGDKHYFYFLNKTAKQLNIKNIFYSNNGLEKTYFKYGFANIAKFQKNPKMKAYRIGFNNEIKLISYYLSHFIANNKYLNSSIFDTISGYYSSYTTSKPYIYLYNFIPWEEKQVDQILINEYNWETSPDFNSTWRIGDGTASFYNYIYYKLAGLIENDTFRSNQIREGVLTRYQALALSAKENQPRWDSIIWYCNTIGLDAGQTLEAINRIKPLY